MKGFYNLYAFLVVTGTIIVLSSIFVIESGGLRRRFLEHSSMNFESARAIVSEMAGQMIKGKSIQQNKNYLSSAQDVYLPQKYKVKGFRVQKKNKNDLSSAHDVHFGKKFKVKGESVQKNKNDLSSAHDVHFGQEFKVKGESVQKSKNDLSSAQDVHLAQKFKVKGESVQKNKNDLSSAHDVHFGQKFKVKGESVQKSKNDLSSAQDVHLAQKFKVKGDNVQKNKNDISSAHDVHFGQKFKVKGEGVQVNGKVVSESVIRTAKPVMSDSPEKGHSTELGKSGSGNTGTAPAKKPLLSSDNRSSSISEKITFKTDNTEHRNTIRNLTSTSTSGSAMNSKNSDSRLTTAAIQRLSVTLSTRLREAAALTTEFPMEATCNSSETISNSCDRDVGCLRKTLPSDVSERIAQLVNPPELHVNSSTEAIMQDLRQKVKGHYDVILITGASDNHFLESQAMIKNVHENIFPHLKNFKFLFYDMGLSTENRKIIAKYCKCQVLDFPFNKFPAYMTNLRCFSWKPLLIKAHVEQANVTIWADASIRFHDDPSHLHTLIKLARQRGILIGKTNSQGAVYTHQKTYHFFGDEPCAYRGMLQGLGGIGFYARDRFVIRVILEPWVACGLDTRCMCVMRFSPHCVPKPDNILVLYGICHRFDQSAISLILHKLYQHYYLWVISHDMVRRHLDVQRAQTTDYFSRLYTNSTIEST